MINILINIFSQTDAQAEMLEGRVKDLEGQLNDLEGMFSCFFALLACLKRAEMKCLLSMPEIVHMGLLPLFSVVWAISPRTL